jgi:hypothetical protein
MGTASAVAADVATMLAARPLHSEKREPRSERQAFAWARQRYFFEHLAELLARQADGIGVQSVVAQRQERGAAFAYVGDWSELDGHVFTSRVARPLADVLLTLITFKKYACVQGRPDGLADMLGTFGTLCSGSAVRLAVDELRPLGLRVEHMYELHPEGFHCRADRVNDPDETRRLRRWREAAPLYSFTPGSELAQIVEAARRRKKHGKSSSFRLASNSNLSGASGLSDQKPKARAREQQPNVNAPAAAGSSLLPTPDNGMKERPTAAIVPTAPPLAAPEATPEGKDGEGGDPAAVAPNAYASGPADASEPRSRSDGYRERATPPIVLRAAQRPVTPAELVRDLATLACIPPDKPTRAARLAELTTWSEFAELTPANDDGRPAPR